MTDKDKKSALSEERVAWIVPHLEALLFSSSDPLTAARLASLIGGGATPAQVKAAAAFLSRDYEETGRSFLLEEVAGGFQITTRPEFARTVSRLFTGHRKSRLTQAGLETLAIIAYRQPVTRQQIERIRGVDAGGVVTTLLERNLIRIRGRSDAVGRPFLFGTTKHFLEYLGLKEIADLPRIEELEALLDRKELEREIEQEVHAKLGAPPDEVEVTEGGADKVARIEEHRHHHDETTAEIEGHGEIIELRTGRSREAAEGESAGSGEDSDSGPFELPYDDGAPLEDLGDALDLAEQTLKSSAETRAKYRPPLPPEAKSDRGAKVEGDDSVAHDPSVSRDEKSASPPKEKAASAASDGEGSSTDSHDQVRPDSD